MFTSTVVSRKVCQHSKCGWTTTARDQVPSQWGAQTYRNWTKERPRAVWGEFVLMMASEFCSWPTEEEADVFVCCCRSFTFKMCFISWGHVHSNVFIQNAYFSIRFGLPSTPRRHNENMSQRGLWKLRFSKTMTHFCHVTNSANFLDILPRFKEPESK